MTRMRARPHVVVVGVNYAPETTGIAPYTTAMAERLVASGYAVTTVTGMPHYPQWRVDDEYRGRLFVEERLNGVRVLRFGSYVPARQSALKRAAFEATFLLSAARVVRYLERPHAILGVVPALSDAILARILAARYRVPYGLIFQDLMGRSAAQSGIPGGGLVATITTRLEAWSAQKARVVASVAARFMPHLVELGIDGNRMMHLPNWTHVSAATGDRGATRARYGWSDGDLVVLHAGNMGLKQGLEQVLNAARAARQSAPHMRFVLVGDGNQRVALQREAADLTNVHFHPFEPESTFPDLLDAADILLVSERATAVDMSLPSKLTSYFASDRPIIAAVPLLGATAQEVRRCGGGLVVPPDQPEALIAAAVRIQADAELAHRISDAGQAYAAESLLAEPALARVDELVSRLTAVASPGGAANGWASDHAPARRAGRE